jgi:ribulose-phosphate 3-epimerase
LEPGRDESSKVLYEAGEEISRKLRERDMVRGIGNGGDVHISASILAADWSALGRATARAAAGGVDSVHIDVMDGHYVHNLTFGPKLLPCLRRHSDLPFVVHLEIENPDAFIEDFAEAGANLVIVHQDTCPDLPATVSRIHACGMKAGLALNPEDSAGKVIDLIDRVDLALVMSVQPGFGGQPLMRSTLDKVRALRNRAEGLDVSPLIGLDGGINSETIEDCVAAGANFLAIGTAIYGDGRPAENVRELRYIMRGLFEDSEPDRTVDRRQVPSTMGQPGGA